MQLMDLIDDNFILWDFYVSNKYYCFMNCGKLLLINNNNMIFWVTLIALLVLGIWKTVI